MAGSVSSREGDPWSVSKQHWLPKGITWRQEETGVRVWRPKETIQ